MVATSNNQIVKVACGKFIKELNLTFVGKHIECRFGFNRGLIAIVKALEGAHWCGYDDTNPRKIWTISDSQHNRFRIRYMNWLAQPLAYRNENPTLDPYHIYDIPLVEFHSDRKLYDHQIEMAALALTRHYCGYACEMGTGKTLAVIEAAEKAGMQTGDVWYVGPKAGCKAVPRELKKWNCNHDWRFFTYEGLVKFVADLGEDGCPAPKFFIIDEASKAKNPAAQRSQAVAHIADAVREEHGQNGYVVTMSGTPAPKDPSDWWHQVRILAPGFLAEGSKEQFKRSLCLLEQRESIAGGSYPHLVTWWDDAKKCGKCGDTEQVHDDFCGHNWEASEDKVSDIYRRLRGLIVVKFKADCLDLPEKRYEIIDIMPTPEMLRTAKMIAKHSGRAAQTMNLLRQLSDGFQYFDEKVGEEVCPECQGAKECMVPMSTDEVKDKPSSDIDEGDFEMQMEPCDFCGASGMVPIYKRSSEVVGSPKDEYFINDLDEHEEIGRYIAWGGFQGTVDRLIDMAHKHGWATLSVDGRGYHGISALGEILDDELMLDAMDASHPNCKALAMKYPKICFCGNPDAGGMALTLTASPTSLYYSNSFKGESRTQSLERGHRAGMPNWTHTIKDMILLPTDQLVLDNLNKKDELEKKSMGRIKVTHDEILECFQR